MWWNPPFMWQGDYAFIRSHELLIMKTLAERKPFIWSEYWWFRSVYHIQVSNIVTSLAFGNCLETKVIDTVLVSFVYLSKIYPTFKDYISHLSVFHIHMCVQLYFFTFIFHSFFLMSLPNFLLQKLYSYNSIAKVVLTTTIRNKPFDFYFLYDNLIITIMREKIWTIIFKKKVKSHKTTGLLAINCFIERTHWQD